ncbi:MAG: hypothetical protein GX567_18950 [Clostridia bacterium]|nr:hypothetical protein [Clostridia bacterium]
MDNYLSEATLGGTDLKDKIEQNKLLIIAALIFMAGVAVGVLLSPVKKGFHFAIGSNNSVRNSGDGTLFGMNQKASHNSAEGKLQQH